MEAKKEVQTEYFLSTVEKTLIQPSQNSFIFPCEHIIYDSSSFYIDPATLT
jgi:hypothetical protein